MSAPARCETERLVAYLYEEDEPDQRRITDAHLAGCSACARELRELRGVRHQLKHWEAPEIELGFRIHRAPDPTPVVRRWWPVPAWAQATAAVLVLTVGAALANVDLRYGRFSLRVGWDHEPTSAAASAAAQQTPPPPPARAASEAAWRAELDRVAQQLRAEMESAAREARDARSAAVDSDALVGRMRALITESERRQQRELAFRLTQVIHDFERQRQNDLARIEQTFGQLEGFTGAEAARQRELLNYLMRVSQQR